MMQAVKLILRSPILGVAVGLLTAYLALAAVAAQRQLLPLDGSVRTWVQPWRSGGLDLSMEMISVLGEPAGLIPLIVIASAVLWRSSRQRALLLPMLMAGAGVLQLVGKWAADRPRPNAAPWGFPSGHVLSLVVFVGALAFLLLGRSVRRRSGRILACLVGGVMVGLVAVSRVYLDMHWLSDVVGGFTLGTAYLLTAIWTVQTIHGRAGPQTVLAAADPSEPSPPRGEAAEARPA
jgi:membrane-associated phospholipid phosphatase